MGEVIKGFIEISHIIDPKIVPEKMLADWNKMVQEVKSLTKDIKNGKDFVQTVHEYLRVTLNYKYSKSGWDFLSSIIYPEKCNCICSSLLIALLANEFGYFPKEIVVGHSPEHVFLMTADRKEYFETTNLCKSSWIPKNQYLKMLNLNPKTENILPVDTISQVLQMYAVEADHYNPGRTKEIFDIVRKYSSLSGQETLYYPYFINEIYEAPLFPGYYENSHFLGGSKGGTGVENEQYIDDLNAIVDAIEKSNTVGSQCDTLAQLIGLTLSLGHQLDKLYLLTSRVLQLLHESISKNPRNVYIRESFNRTIGNLLDSMVGTPVRENVNFYSFFRL